MSHPTSEPAAATDSDRVRGALRSVAELARRHGSDTVARESEGLLRRTDEGRFFLAVVGQFKRGKSTLVNALLGSPVLPTGVVPVTAVVTILEYGERARALVERQDGGEEEVPLEAIADFVTEDRNPKNRRGVAAVIVRYPAPLLRQGISIVDTPGVGSVFELNTAATHSFVPKVDAALVVLGADPPISADELRLVERIARQVPDLLFVLNKSDLVPDKERAEAAAFCSRILAERLGGPVPEILFVSAKQTTTTAGLPASMLEGLRKRLVDLAERAGSRLVLRAVERGVQRLAAELAGALSLERRALTGPLESLEARIEEFRRQSLEIGRMLDDLDYQLRAEVEKTARRLNAEAQDFLAAEKPRLAESVGQRLAVLLHVPGRRLREAAGQEVRAVLEERLDAWLKQMEPRVDEHYRRLTDRFVQAANTCAARISEAAGQVLGLSVDPAPPEPGLRQASRLYYRLEIGTLFLDPGSALTRLTDRFSGLERRLARVREAAVAQAEHFLHTNVTRIVDDLNERVEESLRRFKFELRGRLESALRTAQGAQARAVELKRAGAAAVAGEVHALDDALAELDGLQRGTAGGSSNAAGDTGLRG